MSNTPSSFIAEAKNWGVSKRIPALPNDFRINEDWVYLAYLKLIPSPKKSFRLPTMDEPDGSQGYRPGIFYAFRPIAVELIITETQSFDKDLVDQITDAGVTPVVVPDDDSDHNPRARGKKPRQAPVVSVRKDGS